MQLVRHGDTIDVGSRLHRNAGLLSLKALALGTRILPLPSVREYVLVIADAKERKRVVDSHSLGLEAPHTLMPKRNWHPSQVPYSSAWKLLYSHPTSRFAVTAVRYVAGVSGIFARRAA